MRERLGIFFSNTNPLCFLFNYGEFSHSVLFFVKQFGVLFSNDTSFYYVYLLRLWKEKYHNEVKYCSQELVHNGSKFGKLLCGILLPTSAGYGIHFWLCLFLRPLYPLFDNYERHWKGAIEHIRQMYLDRTANPYMMFSFRWNIWKHWLFLYYFILVYCFTDRSESTLKVFVQLLW